MQGSVRILKRAAIEVDAIGKGLVGGTDSKTKVKNAEEVDQEIGRLGRTEMVRLLRARASQSGVLRKRSLWEVWIIS